MFADFEIYSKFDFSILCQVKYARLTLMFMFEELKIIRETEKQDNDLLEHVEDCSDILAKTDAEVS